MAVDVPPGLSVNPGKPRALFSLAGYRSARNRQQYDVALDNHRFVMIRESGANESGLVYAEHWFGELLSRLKR